MLILDFIRILKQNFFKYSVLFLMVLTSVKSHGRDWMQSKGWPTESELQNGEAGFIPLSTPPDVVELKKNMKSGEIVWDANTKILNIDMKDYNDNSRLKVYYNDKSIEWFEIIRIRPYSTGPLWIGLPYVFLGWSENLGQVYSAKKGLVYFTINKPDNFHFFAPVDEKKSVESIPGLGKFTPWSPIETKIKAAVERGDADAADAVFEGRANPKYGMAGVLVNDIRRLRKPIPDPDKLESDYESAKNINEKITAFSNTLRSLQNASDEFAADKSSLHGLSAYGDYLESESKYLKYSKLFRKQLPDFTEDYEKSLGEKEVADTPGLTLFKHALLDRLMCRAAKPNSIANQLASHWFGSINVNGMYPNVKYAPSYRDSTQMQLLSNMLSRSLMDFTPLDSYMVPEEGTKIVKASSDIPLELSYATWNTQKLEANLYDGGRLVTTVVGTGSTPQADAQAVAKAKYEMEEIDKELEILDSTPLGKTMKGGNYIVVNRSDRADGRTSYFVTESSRYYQFGVGDDARSRNDRRTQLKERRKMLERVIQTGGKSATTDYRVENTVIAEKVKKYCGTHILPVIVKFGGKQAVANAEWKIICGKDFAVENLTAWENHLMNEDHVKFAMGLSPAIRLATSALVSDDPQAPWMRYWIGTGPRPDVGLLGEIADRTGDPIGEQTEFWKEEACTK